MLSRLLALVPRGALISAALLALSHTASAHEMQLQDYGLWSYYQFSHDNKPLGSVTRESWRQPLRRKFVSHDEAGAAIATAHQTKLWTGRLLASNAHMVVTAADGQHLGRFVGSLWVPYAASFTLYNGQDEAVARITLDRHAQFLAIRDPADWAHVMGYASRVQQATRGKDSWMLGMPAQEVPIDARVWPLVMAYFGDTWGKMAQNHTEG